MVQLLPLSVSLFSCRYSVASRVSSETLRGADALSAVTDPPKGFEHALDTPRQLKDDRLLCTRDPSDAV